MGTSEKDILNNARTLWRRKLYEDTLARKENEIDPEESGVDLDHLTFTEVVNSYSGSLGVKKSVLEKDLKEVREDRATGKRAIATDEEGDEDE